MSNILNVYDKNKGKYVGIPAIKGDKGDIGPQGSQGPTGKTAYEYAVDGGYFGTEEEFKMIMADAETKSRVDELVGTERSATGEFLSLDTPDPSTISALTIYGKSTQKTTTGKNLANSDGASVGTAWNGLSNAERAVIYCDAEPDTMYTLSYNAPSVFHVFFKANVEDTSVISSVDNVASGTCFSTPSTANFICIQINKTAVTLADVQALKIQLELGSTATAYEPYTGGLPSPNPSYPQPITNAGDDGLVLTATGKNLFDYSTLTPGKIDAITGENMSIRDGTYCVPYYTPVTGNQCAISGQVGGVRVFYYDSEFNYLGNALPYNQVFALPANCSFIRWHGLLPAFNADTTQIEDGPVITAYEPFGSSASISTALPLCAIPVTSGGNYTDPETGQQYIADTLTVNADGSGQVEKRTVSGSARIGDYPFGDDIANTMRYKIPAPGSTTLSSNIPVTIRDSGLCNFSNVYIRDYTMDAHHFYFDDGHLFLYLSKNMSQDSVVSFVAPRETIQTIHLAPSEVKAILQLNTFSPTTNIYNNAGAPQVVHYATGTTAKIHDARKHTSVVEVNSRIDTFVRPNLLDNWYFGNPVNQRGQTSYSGSKYGIDRWKSASYGLNVTVANGCLSLINAGSNAAYFLQLMDSNKAASLINKQITISVLTQEGRLYSVSGVYGVTSIYTVTDFGSLYSSNVNSELLTFSIAGGNTVNVVAVKAELGSGQTLARQDENGKWVLNEIPDYGEQLRRCQRYFQRIATDSTAVFTLGIAQTKQHIRYTLNVEPMRAKPTVTSSGVGYIKSGVVAADLQSITPSILTYYSNTGVILFQNDLGSEQFTVGEAIQIGILNSGYLNLSADL